MEITFLGLDGSQWGDLAISFLIVMAMVILGRWVITLVLDRGFQRLAARTKTGLDNAILDTVRLPLYWLGVVFALDVAIRRLTFVEGNWIEPLFYVLYLLVGFAFAYRFIQNFFLWYGQEVSARTETELDEQLMPFFRRVALIILVIIGMITLLDHFNVEVGAMITTLGIGSLAIALAAQSVLSDTFSGFFIMIDRPFRIGDRVEIQDLDTWGDVVDIGLRSTHIRTRDNRTVIIPNSVLGKSLVVNHSYPDTQYRIQVNIGIAYGSDLERARQVMIEAVSNAEGVVQERPVEALFLEFGPSTLIFRVRWWIESYADTRRMFDKVNTALYHALNQAGIQIPYPQFEVHHQFGPGEMERATGMIH